MSEAAILEFLLDELVDLLDLLLAQYRLMFLFGTLLFTHVVDSCADQYG